MRLPRRTAPPITPAPGERVLAWAESDDGPVAGTRDALYLQPGPDGAPLRLAWDEVEAADWDQDTGVLTVRGVGAYGEPRPEHRRTLTRPGRLLELLRERVSASIVLTRHVPVDGPFGVTLIGRRSSSGERRVAWFVDYDAGLDPADPLVELAVQDALASLRAEVGDA